MSPEIRMNGELIADVPDDYGYYPTLDGNSHVLVDSRQIDANKTKQILILGGSAIGERRIIGLTNEGKGSSSNTKRGGDGKEPILDVILRDRPIKRVRNTYTSRNPMWIRRYRDG